VNVTFNSPEIEICIDAATPEKTEKEVRAAHLGEVDRIELCDQIELGGTTPQKQCIEIARNIFPRRNGLIVMIRPRGNNFFFSVKEIRQMHESIDVAAKAGADGVALGALRSAEGIAYTQELSELITHAHSANLEVTLHRAFDAIHDQTNAIEWAKINSVKRILTSGTPWGVNGGPDHSLRRLQEISVLADGQIEIVAAGGIDLCCAKKVVTALTDLPSSFSLHIFSGVRICKNINVKRIKQIREKINQGVSL